MPNEDDEKIHIPGLGETEILPGGAITESNAVPEMPPGSNGDDLGRGTMDNAAASSEPGGDYRTGDLDTTDLGQPSSAADTTGDRATGLTGMRGG